MWQTPHACTLTSSSPWPGMGSGRLAYRRGTLLGPDRTDRLKQQTRIRMLLGVGRERSARSLRELRPVGCLYYIVPPNCCWRLTDDVPNRGPNDDRPERTPQAQPEVVVDDSSTVPSYSNFCRVTATPEEVILDFGLNPQPFASGRQDVKANQRIVMNFFTAKRLLSAMGMTIQRHEGAFGSIELDVLRRRAGAGAIQASTQRPAGPQGILARPDDVAPKKWRLARHLELSVRLEYSKCDHDGAA